MLAQGIVVYRSGIVVWPWYVHTTILRVVFNPNRFSILWVPVSLAPSLLHRIGEGALSWGMSSLTVRPSVRAKRQQNGSRPWCCLRRGWRHMFLFALIFNLPSCPLVIKHGNEKSHINGGLYIMVYSQKKHPYPVDFPASHVWLPEGVGVYELCYSTGWVGSQVTRAQKRKQ